MQTHAAVALVHHVFLFHRPGPCCSRLGQFQLRVSDTNRFGLCQSFPRSTLLLQLLLLLLLAENVAQLEAKCDAITVSDESATSILIRQRFRLINMRRLLLHSLIDVATLRKILVRSVDLLDTLVQFAIIRCVWQHCVCL